MLVLAAPYHGLTMEQAKGYGFVQVQNFCSAERLQNVSLRNPVVS